MIAKDMTKLQVTVSKKTKMRLDLVVAAERKKGYATKSTVVQQALESYFKDYFREGK